MIDLEKAGTDAALWAQALAEKLGELGNDALDPTPGGVLHGWCANMIERGRSAGYDAGYDAGYEDAQSTYSQE